MKLTISRTGGAGAVVTPFTGVWIEIRSRAFAASMSPVTPFTGVWIEIRRWARELAMHYSHTLHGCVD